MSPCPSAGRRRLLAVILSGAHVGSPRKGDSEFRILAEDAAVAMETALPEEFPGAGHASTGTYQDRFGTRLMKTFGGEATIDGKAIDYPSWPLVDNPWIHQERDGNMVIHDETTERIHDVGTWTITERKLGTEASR